MAKGVVKGELCLRGLKSLPAGGQDGQEREKKGPGTKKWALLVKGKVRFVGGKNLCSEQVSCLEGGAGSKDLSELGEGLQGGETAKANWRARSTLRREGVRKGPGLRVERAECLSRWGLRRT